MFLDQLQRLVSAARCSRGERQPPNRQQMLGRKFDYSLKVVVVGDSGVGKTCFLIRFVRDMFDEESQPTLGVEFLTKVVQTERHRIQLQLWDTAGQELFRSVTRGYYRGSAGALIVFDLTSRDSFDSVARWVQDIRDVARSDVVTMLIGNKSDLIEKRSISAEEAAEFAKKNSMQYFETSARTGENITPAVDACVAVIEKNVDDGAYEFEPSKAANKMDFTPEKKESKCNC
jgi:small GTP-binding protein